MFPIIGPTNEADFNVKTARGTAIQDQHGLLREMEYTQISKTESSSIFEKKYIKNTPVPNSKYPEKSTEENLSWPYDFTFKKSFNLNDDGLEISFEITGEEGMPFMLGYHPAFNIITKSPMIIAPNKEISLEEILAVGNRAMPVLDCKKITLKDQKSITIETEGFGNFMLWTEVQNMVCIEPITFYPYAVDQNKLHTGFQHLQTEEKKFVVKISVAE